jgi:hypothetical protein
MANLANELRDLMIGGQEKETSLTPNGADFDGTAL